MTNRERSSSFVKYRMGLRLLLVSTYEELHGGFGCKSEGGTYALQTAFENLLSVHFLLYRTARDEAINDHVSCLAHAVTTVNRLRIHRRVPSWVEYNHSVGAIERDAHAAALRRQEKHVDARV